MTFTLRSIESEATVTTRGGELISFVNHGNEYIWQGDPKYWCGRSPILFPVVCSPKDGIMSHRGVDYPMPKHGFACLAEFEPIYISRSKVILEQRETEETLKMFPYCYSLRVEHSVTDEGFTTRYTVRNFDKYDMTFCIGGHPGFNCPISENDGSFEDYSLFFADTRDCTVSITKDGFMNDEVPKMERLNGTNELPLKYSDFDNDALIVENLREKTVSLISNKSECGIKFTFDGFDALGIWTPEKQQAPFVCLEPWNGLPADPLKETTDAKSKKYAVTIAPNEEYTVQYAVEIIR